MSEQQPAPPEQNAAPEPDVAARQAQRSNAKRILQESGCATMMRILNREQLKNKGWFEEYDSGVLLKWGTFSTRRHVWVEVQGEAIRFRLLPHLKCKADVPICDGEYHTLLREHWQQRTILQDELAKNFAKPVAEPSAD